MSKESWNKFLYYSWFTKRIKIKEKNLSDICEVTDKAAKEDFVPMGDGITYILSFNGTHLQRTHDMETYFNFNVGDKIKVNYCEYTKQIFNFVPPNFIEKQLINEEVKYIFLNAEKVNQ